VTTLADGQGVLVGIQMPITDERVVFWMVLKVDEQASSGG